MTKIAILGGGSWGTGLAVVLANSRRSHDIALWVREPGIAESIKQLAKPHLPSRRRYPVSVMLTITSLKLSATFTSSSAWSRPHTRAPSSPKRFSIFRRKPSS